MNNFLELVALGRVTITEVDTGKIVLAKTNAVHPQNMALAIARSLSREANGGVFKMSFGNGGTFFNSSSQIVYRSPNVIGDSDLYNLTYEVQVDEQSTGTPVSNSVTSSSSPSPSITSIVTATALLSAGEPSGQASADNVTTDPESPYVFDEIALKTSDNLLLTHLIFSPIEKTANRAYVINYTLTISVS